MTELTKYTDDLTTEIINADHAGLMDGPDSRMATHLLASPVLARIVADAEKRGQADAWAEGYLRGALDFTADLEPADNPYRTVEKP